MEELYQLLRAKLHGLPVGAARVEVWRGDGRISVLKVNTVSGDVEAGWQFTPDPI